MVKKQTRSILVGTGVGVKRTAIHAIKRQKRDILSGKIVTNLTDPTPQARKILKDLARPKASASQPESEKDDNETEGFRADEEGVWMDVDYETSAEAQLMVDVLRGKTSMDISHAGQAELFDEYTLPPRPKRIDNRTQADRVLRFVENFRRVLPEMTCAFKLWRLETMSCGMEALGKYSGGGDGPVALLVVDLFWRKKCSVHGDAVLPVAARLTRQGLIPCSPLNPSVAFTARTMETYRLLRLQCPQLSAERFAKFLGDFHLRDYRRNLRTQFSNAFDIYVELLEAVEQEVLQCLERDRANYRVAHACPCCQYKLQEEPELRFSMLGTWDGNNSQRRVERREALRSEQGKPKLGASKERDPRVGGGDYFIPYETCLQYSKDTQDMHRKDAKSNNPCQERWHNMKSNETAKAWGIYKETGIFTAVCRHGFLLVATDMIRSGELSMYMLACLAYLLAELPDSNLAMGYDIGCSTKTTIQNSSLGKLAAEKGFESLVGTFHGHAHNRLCQLTYLGTYVEGLGLEDLETCERLYSRLNALAAPLRYTSSFHRRQALAGYFKHLDRFDTYSHLADFLCGNYRQALEILATEPAMRQQMLELGVDSEEELKGWLQEEKEYLTLLEAEPQEETWRMEYFDLLVKLEASEGALEAAEDEWIAYNPLQCRTDFNATRKLETAQREARENYIVLLKSAQKMEDKFNLRRWERGSFEWQEAEAMKKNRDFQRCLDKLEGLVVKRLFELTKMNMSGTGYKLRKHIATSLQTRSKAVRRAIVAYNEAARRINPPGRQVSWDEVVDYAFLSEFDLLRDPRSRESVEARPWSTPAGRALMTQWFKLQRAREEITRVNVEIRRLITYIEDEDRFINHMANVVEKEDPALALQVHLYGQGRARFHPRLKRKLAQLEKNPGFNGNLSPGVSVEFPERRQKGKHKESDAFDADGAAESDDEHSGEGFDETMEEAERADADAVEIAGGDDDEVD